MADISRHSTDLSDHPDVAEMRARYERITQSGQAVVIDGLVLLAGLYLAISPWVVHFSTTSPNMAANNLILGLTVAVIALGLSMAPGRMHRMSWAAVAIGIWTIISPWVIRSTGTGIVINNIVIGAVTVVLGLAAAAILMTPRVRAAAR